MTASGAEFRPYSVAVRKLDNLEAGGRIEVHQNPGRMPLPLNRWVRSQACGLPDLRSPDGTRLYWSARRRTMRETLVDTTFLSRLRDLRRSSLSNEFPQAPKRRQDVIDVTFVIRASMDGLLPRQTR